jgi:hypothetical protein
MATALSYITYNIPGDAPVGTTEFDLIFEGPSPGYLSRDHIYLRVNDLPVDVGGGYGVDGFTWVTDTRVSLKNYSPVDGDKIEFRRTMPKDDIYVDFVDRAGITEKMLDDQSLATLYIVHEVQDGVATGVEAAVDLARSYANAAEDYEVEPGNYSSYHWSEKSKAWTAAAQSAASDAETSETNAAASEDLAEKWADEEEDVEVVAGAYSAKHHATKAIASSDLAEDWSSEAEDVVVEGGKYSAYHWAQKAASNSRSVTVHRHTEQSTSGQTTVTPGFTMDTVKPNVAVFLDGIKQAYDSDVPANGDFTFTSTVVTFTTALPADDITILVESQDVSGVTEAPAFADEAGDLISLKTPLNYTLDTGEPKAINQHLSGIDSALVTLAPGIQNYFVNGDFRIAQRGTSATGIGGSQEYVMDMTAAYTLTGDIDLSREAAPAGLLALKPGVEYMARMVINTAGGFNVLRCFIEDASNLNGAVCTVSFFYRATAGTDAKFQIVQDFGSGGSGDVDAIDVTLNDDGDWHYYNNTFTMPSTSGKSFGTKHHLKGEWYTLSNTGTIEIAEVKLEPGDVATDLGRIPSWDALKKCERYYQEFSSSTGPSWNGQCVNTNQYELPIQFPTKMADGTSVVITDLTIVDDSGGTPGFNVSTATAQSMLTGTGFLAKCTAQNSFDFSRFRVTDWTAKVEY